MAVVGVLVIGAVIGAMIAGPWWWKAGRADGYYSGVNDANALICGEVPNVPYV